MSIENYTVGSIADLISGKNTPNKTKVIRKELKKAPTKNVPSEAETTEGVIGRVNKRKIGDNISNERFQPKKKRKSKHKPEASWSAEQFQPRKRHKSTYNTENPGEAKGALDRQRNGVNAQELVKRKQNQEKEELVKDRTVFVGNIPIHMSKKKLQKVFMKYGKVESVRVRGVPVADARVSKKVAYIKKEFHPDRTSVHGYVRFTTPEEAKQALVLNGQLLQDHHLRVKLCDEQEKPDTSKAIFIGNVSFNAEEEDVWRLFEPCGDIDSVRLVRDPATGIGKGFGYVNFKNSDSVELAMQMENPTLKGRELRVSICKSNPGKKKEKKRRNENRSRKKGEGGTNEGEQRSKEKPKMKGGFEGFKVTEKRKKKKKPSKGLLQKKQLVKKLTPKTT